MIAILPSLLWGLVAYTLYGFAMVLMKLGEPALSSPRQIFKNSITRRQAVIWCCGVGCNFTFAVTLGIALGLGYASVVAALNGVGLIVVAVLSWIMLGERLAIIGISGMALVIIGIALIGLWSAAPAAGDASGDTGGFIFWGAVMGGCVLATAGGLLVPALGGPLLGTTAGALGGAAMLFQKMFMTPLVTQDALEATALWHLTGSLSFWLWALTATGSFVVLQFAFRFGEATRVTPAMVSAMILVPQTGGVALFAEQFTWVQVCGSGIVIIGVVMLCLGPPATLNSPAASLS